MHQTTSKGLPPTFTRSSSQIIDLPLPTHSHSLTDSAMGKITSIEYFRVLPRWLFVKVTDEGGNYGWGESTLEGHTEAIEGSLSELIERFVGYEAE